MRAHAPAMISPQSRPLPPVPATNEDRGAEPAGSQHLAELARFDPRMHPGLLHAVAKYPHTPEGMKLGMQDYLVQKADQPIENGGQVEGRVASR
jgi:hypothetical protein